MNTSEKVKYISNWIKTYVDQMPSKAQSLVIGISGGIDSSVSSTLSAMTGLKTIVLSMPIKQKSTQHDLSIKHQEWLVNKFKNVEAHTINLDKLFLAFNSSLSNVFLLPSCWKVISISSLSPNHGTTCSFPSITT